MVSGGLFMPVSLACIRLGSMPCCLNCDAHQIITDVKPSTKNSHVICCVGSSHMIDVLNSIAIHS